MKINETVGIDISKKTIDVCMHIAGLTGVFENSKKGFAQMYASYRANAVCPENEAIFILEHTGLYSEQLSYFMSLKKVHP